MTTRKEASVLSPTEQARYVNTIKQLLADPSNPYGKMVAIHGNMAHNMHGMNAVGTQRFLPWHRDYLLQFEHMLQGIDTNAFIPYWDWTKNKGVPKWLKTFKPTVNIPGYGVVVVKRNAALAAKVKVNVIMQLPDYTTFTDQLENGPHGDVHMGIGLVKGVRQAMANIRISPADPIFWLHHAQIDRLWSQWQANHTGETPTLSGNNAVMDPWIETATQLDSIAALNYSYQ